LNISAAENHSIPPQNNSFYSLLPQKKTDTPTFKFFLNKEIHFQSYIFLGEGKDVLYNALMMKMASVMGLIKVTGFGE